MKKLFCCLLIVLSWTQVAFTQLPPKPTKIKHVRATKQDLKWAKRVGYKHATGLLDASQLVEDKDLQKYLDELVRKLLKHTPKYFRYFSYRIYVVKYPLVGATAFTNGEIVIDEQFLCSLVYEDTLAVVIGHEIAHPGLRHKIGENRLSYKNREQLQELYRKKEADLLVQVQEKINQSLLVNYYRGHELDSDLFPIRIVMLAGYDPSKAAEYMLSSPLFKEDEEHPSAEIRARRSLQEIEALKSIWSGGKPTPRLFPEFLRKRCSVYVKQ